MALPGSLYCRYHKDPSDDDGDTKDDSDRIWCAALNNRDLPCKYYVMPGELYCKFHRDRRNGDDEEGNGEVDYEDDDEEGDDEEDVYDDADSNHDSGRIRCAALNQRELPCKFNASRGKYCKWHQKPLENEVRDEIYDVADPNNDNIDRKRCSSLNNRDLPCKFYALPGELCCRYHQKARKRVEGDDGIYDDADEDLEESSVSDESDRQSETDEDQNPRRCKWFSGLPGTHRCTAATNRGLLCRNVTVVGTRFCRLHILNPTLLGVTIEQSFADSLGSTKYLIMPYSEMRKRARSLRQNGTMDFDADDDFLIKKPAPGSSAVAVSLTDKGSSLASLPRGSSMGSATISTRDDIQDDRKIAASMSPDSDDVNFAPNKRDKLFKRRKNQERCIYLSARGKPCPFQAVNSTVCCFRHAQYMQDFLTPVPSPDSESAQNPDGFETENSDDDNRGETDDEEESHEADTKRPYKHKEFLKMWKECETWIGENIDEIESTRRVRGANHSMSPEDTDGQQKAQYGRLLPVAMKKMTKEILGLTKDDVFLDIGHGIGNTVIQAAFTAGCESRGIEVVYGRNSIAEVFRGGMLNQHRDNGFPHLVGEILLRHGRLEDATHREFLTQGVTRIFVNNFNGVFAERSCKLNQNWFLDDYVAALFAVMKAGAVMITFHPLNMGPTRSEANRTRQKQGLTESDNSSFYEVERVLLGKACDTVKWCQHSGNQQKIYVYRYTRLAQPHGVDPVFLCCNAACDFAKNDVVIPGTTTNEEGRSVINHCTCRVTAKNLRRQRRKSYSEI